MYSFEQVESACGKSVDSYMEANANSREESNKDASRSCVAILEGRVIILILIIMATTITDAAAAAAVVVTSNVDDALYIAGKNCCPHCGSSELEHDASQGNTFCTHCGCIVEENTIVSEVTFVEGPGGHNTVAGQFVDASGRP